MQQEYRIVIADDHAFLRRGLASVLQHHHEFLIAGEAGHGLELIHLLCRGVVPDLLILDLSMPVVSGLEVLRQIRQMDFVFKVLVLTMHKEPDLLCQALSAGANGYMLKDDMAKELLPALHTLLEDRVYLSPLIAAEVRDTCQMKVAAEQRIPFSSVKHCGRSLAGPQEESALST